MLPALGELLPGGLARGSVVAAGRWSLLCLALAAGASVAGAWCAVAGVPQLGVSAAVGVGLDPARLLLVPDPGTAWPQVVASLLDGCELVLLRPPDRAPATVRRRLEAVLRRCGGVLVVAGDWDGAQARLLVTRQEWAGIEPGHGRLRARRVLVVADGRGAAARPRTRWLWLPGPDGSVGPADQTVRHAGHRVTTPGAGHRDGAGRPPGCWWCGARTGRATADPDAARAFEQVVSLVEELCPRVEVLHPGACAIGARGPARYFGGEEALAGKIIETVAGGGFACSAGVADGLFAARLAARAAAPGTATVVPPGQAREFLAPYPVSVLDSEELTELLPRLGIVTLEDFARLPASQAVNRFGAPGGAAHRLARGLDPRPLAARPPAADLSVSVAFDPPGRAGRARGVRRQGARRADA